MADREKKRTPDDPWNERHEASDPQRSESQSEPSRPDSDELIDEASDESFPASDPPSFNPTRAGSSTERDDRGVERESPTGDDRRSNDVERESE